MGSGLGTQVGLRDDDDIQGLGKLFVEHLHLVQGGLDVPLDGGRFAYCPGRLSSSTLAPYWRRGPRPA